MGFLPRTVLRKLGPVGVALTVYDVWRRIPPHHRQLLLEQGQKHGARAARYVVREGTAQLHKRRG
jgi:hypothetical protein